MSRTHSLAASRCMQPRTTPSQFWPLAAQMVALCSASYSWLLRGRASRHRCNLSLHCSCSELHTHVASPASQTAVCRVALAQWCLQGLSPWLRHCQRLQWRQQQQQQQDADSEPDLQELCTTSIVAGESGAALHVLFLDPAGHLYLYVQSNRAVLVLLKDILAPGLLLLLLLPGRVQMLSARQYSELACSQLCCTRH